MITRIVHCSSQILRMIHQFQLKFIFRRVCVCVCMITILLKAPSNASYALFSLAVLNEQRFVDFGWERGRRAYWKHFCCVYVIACMHMSAYVWMCVWSLSQFIDWNLISSHPSNEQRKMRTSDRPKDSLTSDKQQLSSSISLFSLLEKSLIAQTRLHVLPKWTIAHTLF